MPKSRRVKSLSYVLPKVPLTTQEQQRQDEIDTRVSGNKYWKKQINKLQISKRQTTIGSDPVFLSSNRLAVANQVDATRPT